MPSKSDLEGPTQDHERFGQWQGAHLIAGDNRLPVGRIDLQRPEDAEFPYRGGRRTDLFEDMLPVDLRAVPTRKPTRLDYTQSGKPVAVLRAPVAVDDVRPLLEAVENLMSRMISSWVKGKPIRTIISEVQALQKAVLKALEVETKA